jgi:hypothetical protein
MGSARVDPDGVALSVDRAFMTGSLLVLWTLVPAYTKPPNGLELSCPAEAGNCPLLYGTPAGSISNHESPARRVSFSELFGSRCDLSLVGCWGRRWPLGQGFDRLWCGLFSSVSGACGDEQTTSQ